MGNVKKEKDRISIIAIVAVLICIGLWIGGMFLSHWYAGKYFEASNENNAPALFGDSFRSVNALISAFAFAGVIVAIIIQRNELRLQRQDLALQREEFSTQNDTLKLQRFENTFFNMLSMQQEIVNNLYYKEFEKDHNVEDAPDPGNGRIRKEVIIERVIQNRELFSFAFNEIPHDIIDGNARNKRVSGIRWYLYYEGLSNYNDSYAASYFDHYFRHLYTIIKFVDRSDFLSFDEKYKYTTMVRATLSRYELIWLYYNGLSDVGKKKFKTLIERYSLLKNIREDLLTLSHENNGILMGHEVERQELIQKGFSGTDYEFFFTEQVNDEDKYYLGAFYNKDEIEEGQRAISAWQTYFNERLT